MLWLIGVYDGNLGKFKDIKRRRIYVDAIGFSSTNLSLGPAFKHSDLCVIGCCKNGFQDAVGSAAHMCLLVSCISAPNTVVLLL